MLDTPAGLGVRWATVDSAERLSIIGYQPIRSVKNETQNQHSQPRNAVYGGELMKNLPIVAALALVVIMLWSWFVPVETQDSVKWWAHTSVQRAESMVR